MKQGKGFFSRGCAVLLLLALLTALLPSAASAAEAQPEAAANPVPEAVKGVVQVCAMFRHDGYYSTGTAFGIGTAGEDTDLFITNWHVVAGEQGEITTELYILPDGANVRDPSTMIACEVLYTTTGYPDFAIIRATEPVVGIKALPLMKAEDASVGSPIFVLGYPGFVDDFSSSTNSRTGDITVTQGIVSRFTQLQDIVQEAGEENAWVVLHTAHSGNGNSGGPLITEYGAVIGIHTYSFYKSDTGNRYQAAVYIDYPMAVLDELGLHYDVYVPGSEPEPTNPPATQPSVPAPTSPPATAPAPTEPAPKPTAAAPAQAPAASSPTPKGNGSALQILVIAGIVLVAVGAVVVLVKVAGGDKGPKITGTGGVHAGQKYSIPGSGLNIGRDASCGIVFPDDAPGVSRMHCRINRDGNTLTITDLSSTYGTYVAGKKIVPNVPIKLRPGVGFYVGSPKNSFVIE